MVTYTVNRIGSSDVEFDDSSQSFQLLASVTVVDGGAPMGAITSGINVDELQNQ
jgi:hypothetical protein